MDPSSNLCVSALEIIQLDKDRTFIAAFRIMKAEHIDRLIDKTMLLPRVICRPRIVAPFGCCKRDTLRNDTYVSVKCEAIAHKSAGETRASPDLHNPFSNSGAFLLTAEVFCYHRSVCNMMRVWAS